MNFLLNFSLLSNMPSTDYSIENYKLLDTLSSVLLLLEAELRVIFNNNNFIDFSGISQGALYALGSEDNPSDLGLVFDYKISHILVDEFQDTSYLQYDLLKRLTASWDNRENLDNNRSLFLVGDPMQSIYRFRQAEVSLFNQVIDNGLGNIKLDYLQLSRNFRSEQQIIDWVNNKFSQILPSNNNNLLGSVSYNNSESTKELNNSLAPKLYLFDKK